VGTLGAAVPAMVAEAYEGLALLVRSEHQSTSKGEKESKQQALRYYENAAPYLQAALPPLHPVGEYTSNPPPQASN